MRCTWSFNSKEYFILVSGLTKWVNLINESRRHFLNSFCSGAAEVDATAPLPPSNKYMDNYWPRLLDTLTSCLNNCGGTQLLLLLLAVQQLLPKWGRVIKPNPPAIAARMALGSGPALLGRRFKDRRGEVVTLMGGQVVRAGNPPVYQNRRPHNLTLAISDNARSARWVKIE